MENRCLVEMNLKSVLSNKKIYDEDTGIEEVLAELEYANPLDFSQDISNHKKMRSQIRYLAALFPYKNINDLTNRIYILINNDNFSIDELRQILNGRLLSDPSKKTNEIPVKVIQGIGKCLSEGMSIRATAVEMRVSYDTVEAIEKYLGIKSALHSRHIGYAVNAVRDGLSVRRFGSRYNIPKSTAHRLLIEAKKVLVELGEVNG